MNAIRSKATLKGHRSVVWQMTWSSDGHYLATSSGDGTIRIWSAPWGESHQIHIVKRPSSLAWCPGTRRIAFTDDANSVYTLDVDSETIPRTLASVDGEVDSVGWSADGQYLYTLDLKGHLVRRDLKGVLLQSVRVPIKDTGPIVRALRNVPTGPLLAAIINPERGDSFIRLWDTETFKQRGDLSWHIHHIYSVAWPPSGEYLVSSSRDKAICVWDLGTGKPSQLLEEHESDPVDLAFSSDGRVLASRDFSGLIRFWRSDDWKMVGSAKTPGGNGGGIAFHPRQPILATRDHRDEIVVLSEIDFDQLLSQNTPVDYGKIGADIVSKESPERQQSILKVFLCHASEDKPKVRKLKKRLHDAGMQPWIDDEDLHPGVEWRPYIENAIRDSHVVVVCLSDHSVTKEGFVQKEIGLVLDIADEKPEGTIFLIPARLGNCTIPSRLRRWQYVDLSARGGFTKLVSALRKRQTEIQERPRS